jgi:hypothetical protein
MGFGVWSIDRHCHFVFTHSIALLDFSGRIMHDLPIRLLRLICA